MEELEQRISTQEVCTFRECLALSSEFSVKTRVIIALILSQGREYIDAEPSDQA